MLRGADDGECEVGPLAAIALVRGRVRVLGTHRADARRSVPFPMSSLHVEWSTQPPHSADHAEPIVDGMVSEPGVQVGGLADVDHLVFEIENLVHVELNGHIRNTLVPNVPVDVQEESVT